MNTNTTTTLSTTKVCDGLQKGGTALITKRGYLMWLKKQHNEHQWSYIFTISRYSAAECPLGRYCAEMGTSIWNAPKWTQKVREYYAGKDHGLVYTAADAKGHMSDLFGYKMSDIFYSTEE